LQVVPEPACVTVTCSPAIVSVPLRWDVPVCAMTLKLTVPVPFPFVPDVIVSQEICSVAVHVQPAGADTEKFDVPVPAVSVRLVGVTSNAHASPC
jgi:hypothetical protein